MSQKCLIHITGHCINAFSGKAHFDDQKMFSILVLIRLMKFQIIFVFDVKRFEMNDDFSVKSVTNLKCMSLNITDNDGE